MLQGLDSNKAESILLLNYSLFILLFFLINIWDDINDINIFPTYISIVTIEEGVVEVLVKERFSVNIPDKESSSHPLLSSYHII